MSGQKLKVMSLSIEPETHEHLKEIAKIDGISVSNLIRATVEKFLLQKDKITVVEHSEDYRPVVLKIPSELIGDERVKEWLRVKAEALGTRLSQKAP